MNMASNNIAAQIKRLREAKGLTKYRLAKLSGIRESYIGQLEAGIVEHPRRDTIAALAKGLEVSPAIFFETDTFTEKPFDILIKEIRERYEALELIEVPILGTIQGSYPFVIEKNPGNVSILKELVDNVAGMENLYALQVEDDNLQSDGIYNGDTVIVDKGETDILKGKLYIIQLENKYIASHLAKKGNLISITFPDGTFKDLTADEVKISGRIILSGRWKKH